MVSPLLRMMAASRTMPRRTVATAVHPLLQLVPGVAAVLSRPKAPWPWTIPSVSMRPMSRWRLEEMNRSSMQMSSRNKQHKMRHIASGIVTRRISHKNLCRMVDKARCRQPCMQLSVVEVSPVPSPHANQSNHIIAHGRAIQRKRERRIERR